VNITYTGIAGKKISISKHALRHEFIWKMSIAHFPKKETKRVFFLFSFFGFT
jgi:hypothetical protein